MTFKLIMDSMGKLKGVLNDLDELIDCYEKNAKLIKNNKDKDELTVLGYVICSKCGMIFMYRRFDKCPRCGSLELKNEGKIVEKIKSMLTNDLVSNLKKWPEIR